MRRLSQVPLGAQVAALAVAAVLLSQAVAFAVVLLAPPPKPEGFTAQQAALALRGRAAETSDGRALRRRLDDTPPAATQGPVERLLTESLAQQLRVPTTDVRIALPRPAPPRSGGVSVRFAKARPEPAGAPPPPHAARVETRIFTLNGPNREPLSILTDRLTFGPFTAAVRLGDGRWAVVEPPRAWLSPWQKQMLIALALSLALLAPLVWWTSRRLARPIHAFASAARRLGADPDADPLPIEGPDEVRTAVAAFNDMQGALRDHMRQRSQTVAAIAHDLRTPLTRLRFRVEQAEDPLRDRMAADIEEMDALIAQAMAYVRGETPSHRHERLDLAALAAEITRGFTETGAVVTAALPCPLWVEADPAALRRALSNLIGNAVKYAGAAEVSGRIDGDAAVIQVADRGPGVADEALERLFEPFRRGEASRSRDTGGAGLGLTVARQAARASGGDVTLASRSGGGLIATLRLPSAD